MPIRITDDDIAAQSVQSDEQHLNVTFDASSITLDSEMQSLEQKHQSITNNDSHISFSASIAETSLSSEEIANRANQLMSAMHGLFTNEDAVFDALKNLSSEDVRQLEEYYLAKFGTTLESDLRSDLSGYDLSIALTLLEPDDLSRRAEVIGKALNSWFDHSETVVLALNGLSQEQSLKLQEIFQTKFGDDLVDRIKGEIDGQVGDRALRSLHIADPTLIALGIKSSIDGESGISKLFELHSGFDNVDGEGSLAANTDDVLEDLRYIKSLPTETQIEVFKCYKNITGHELAFDLREQLDHALSIGMNGYPDVVEAITILDPSAKSYNKKLCMKLI